MLSSFCRSFASVRFTARGGLNKIVEGAIGDTLLHLAEKNEIPMPCACEGQGACGTCHVYITKGMEGLSEVTDGENDTLDFAIEVRDESRLACQAKITDVSGVIELTIPEQSRNIV
jgi:2Fe-2S ferredoxin